MTPTPTPLTTSDLIGKLTEALRDTALETDMKKRHEIAANALAATASVTEEQEPCAACKSPRACQHHGECLAPSAQPVAGDVLSEVVRAAQFTREDLGPSGTNYPHIRTMLGYIESLSAHPSPALPVDKQERPTDDHLWDQTIRDRDTYHEWADRLTAAIAEHFGADFGEHSNMNCPWAEAVEFMEDLPKEPK